MELRQLEYFAAVAQERHFTRASVRLNTVQSAVSATIKSLEREVGAQLFDRTPQHVELTDAGQIFLPRALATLDTARDALEAVQEVGHGLRGTLRVGMLISVGLLDVPGLMGRFHRDHPDVRLQLSTAAALGSEGLAQALAENRLDLAVVSIPGAPPEGVHLRSLASAPLDLLVPTGHPLSGLPAVPITALNGESFIDFPVGYGNRSVTDRAFAAAGVARHVTIEITDLAQCADFVSNDLGVALLPRFAITERPGISTSRVTGADLTWPMALATSTHRTPSAAARALAALVDDHVQASG